MNFEKELDEIIKEGNALCEAWEIVEQEGYGDRVYPNEIETAYQKFYTRACRVVELLAPERLNEFKACYKTDENDVGIKELSYTLNEYFLGVSYWENSKEPRRRAFRKLRLQVDILTGCKALIGSAFQDIEGAIRSNFIDSEISTAGTLIKGGQFRAAGAVYNVAAERHLQAVCEEHSVKVKKGDVKTINDVLKKAGVITSSQWNKVKRIVELRELCYHNTGEEPTKDDLDEFTENIKWLVKQIQ